MLFHAIAPFARVFCVTAIFLSSGICTSFSQGKSFPFNLFDSSSDNSQEIRRLTDSGIAKYEKRDYAGAISDYDRVLKLAPQRFSVYNLRGSAKRPSGDLDGAEADYKHALELEPRSLLAHVGLGHVKEKRGDAAGAREEFQQAIKIDPQSGFAYVDLGNLELAQKNYQQAEENYNLAVARSPDSAAVWLGLTELHLKQDRVADARANVEHALELNPQSVGGHELRGAIKRRQDDLPGALADYRRAVELNPKLTLARRHIAYLEVRLHQYEAALVDAQLVPDHRPGTSTDYLQLLVWSLRTRLGQPAEADRQLSVYLADRPHPAEGDWFDHVGAYLLGREPEDALFEHAKSEDAKTAAGQLCEAWYYMGLRALFVGDKTTAAEHFRRCVATGETTFYEYALAAAELQSL